MASRIPVRRPRTHGAENENPQTTAVTSRAKPTGRAGVLSQRKTISVASTSDATKSKTTRAAEIESILGNRKREALKEVELRKNIRVGSTNGQRMLSGKRQILGLPKGSASEAPALLASLRKAKEVQQVFVPPPVASNAVPVRRLTSRRSLIPVARGNDLIDLDVDDDEEPAAKRQRTSSVAPDDDEYGPSEAEITQLLTEEDVDADFEAEPNGPDWDDLDAADFDDPLMASEYVTDIQLYLKQVELTTLPSPTYMSAQPALDWDLRSQMNDWLIQVHARFHLLPETLFLCMHLMDRFLSLRAVAVGKLQLVGMACLLLASKFEETVSPAIVNFTQISGDAYTADEMRNAEKHILKTLEWDLSYPNPMNWLRRVSKVEGYEPQARNLAKYLAEIALMDRHLVATPPSLLAASAMWLARVALGEGNWVSVRRVTEVAVDSDAIPPPSTDAPPPSTDAPSDSDDFPATPTPATTHDTDTHFTLWSPNLAHYSMYSESELLPTVEHMLRYIVQPLKQDGVFYRKWAAKKNMKVSVYMREWALSRWPEGSTVDLVRDLPGLRKEIRVRKEKGKGRKAGEEQRGGTREVAGEEEEEEGKGC
ncbi:MFS domain-containing protein [Favolaschia claudopus]|uniref:MFS domain-containing protein n=1 Tax=Favolaschia claudopus TaxID=2862362 RepID=A0AAW0BTK6_9AGAR